MPLHVLGHQFAVAHQAAAHAGQHQHEQRAVNGHLGFGLGASAATNMARPIAESDVQNTTSSSHRARWPQLMPKTSLPATSRNNALRDRQHKQGSSLPIRDLAARKRCGAQPFERALPLLGHEQPAHGQHQEIGEHHRVAGHQGLITHAHPRFSTPVPAGARYVETSAPVRSSLRRAVSGPRSCRSGCSWETSAAACLTRRAHPIADFFKRAADHPRQHHAQHRHLADLLDDRGGGQLRWSRIR